MKKITLTFISLVILQSVLGQNKKQQRRADAYYQNQQTRNNPSSNSMSDATANITGALIISLLAYSSANNKTSIHDKMYRGEKGRYEGQKRVKGVLKDILSAGSNRQRHGQGIFYCENGDIKDGAWIYDNFTAGQYFLAKDSIAIRGFFIYKIRVGKISKVSSDTPIGDLYFGEFDYSFLPNGYGILYNEKNIVLKSGIWKNGKLIKKISESKVLKKINKLTKKGEKYIKKHLS